MNELIGYFGAKVVQLQVDQYNVLWLLFEDGSVGRISPKNTPVELKMVLRYKGEGG